VNRFEVYGLCARMKTLDAQAQANNQLRGGGTTLPRHEGGDGATLPRHEGGVWAATTA
jgi:hypothetical protein